MSNKPINIFFAIDEKFVQHLSVTLASILHNANEEDKIDIYIMTKGLSEKSIGKIKSLSYIKPFNLEIVNVDDTLFKNYKAPNYINSTATYYRYIIPTVKPKIDKALYLDCDIVVKQSLKELFDTDLEDNYVAGVEDVHEVMMSVKLKPKLKDISFYFNAGVLLLNCKKMRKDNLTETLFQTTNSLSGRCYLGADQDVLNIACKDKRKLLDLKYNLHSAIYNARIYTNYSTQIIKNAIHNPVIIHYTDRLKPWMLKGFPQNDWAYEYYKYLKLTPFYKKTTNLKLIFLNKQSSYCIKRMKDNTVTRFIIGLGYLFVQILGLMVLPIRGLILMKKYNERTKL